MDRNELTKPTSFFDVIALQIPGGKVADHFRGITKMVKIGCGAEWSTSAERFRDE